MKNVKIDFAQYQKEQIKNINIDLKQFEDEAVRLIEQIIIAYGFSYHACKSHNVNRIDLLSSYQVKLFPELEEKIRNNLTNYHENYLNYITKKCVDDAFHLLENFIISCWKEYRVKVKLVVDEKIKDEYEKFLKGEKDNSIWKIKTFAEKIGFTFSSDVSDFLRNLGEIRKSLHHGGIVQKDATLEYKGFEILVKKDGEDQIISSSSVIDRMEFHNEPVMITVKEIDKKKSFSKGDVVMLQGADLHEILSTIRFHIIPKINKSFWDYYQSFPHI